MHFSLSTPLRILAVKVGFRGRAYVYLVFKFATNGDFNENCAKTATFFDELCSATTSSKILETSYSTSSDARLSFYIWFVMMTSSLTSQNWSHGPKFHNSFHQFHANADHPGPKFWYENDRKNILHLLIYKSWKMLISSQKSLELANINLHIFSFRI